MLDMIVTFYVVISIVMLVLRIIGGFVEAIKNLYR